MNANPPDAPRRKPRFLRQGMLLLLPMVVLAVAGLVVLRQDRSSVEQAARSRAGELASTAVAQLDEFFQQLTADGSGWSMRSNFDSFIINSSNQLVSPPPLVWPPVANPLPLPQSVLSSNKLSQWNAAEAAFNSNDWAESAQLYLAFVDGRTRSTDPQLDSRAGMGSQRYRWTALFRRAIAFEKAQDNNAAVGAYNDILNGFHLGGEKDNVSEAGIGLAPLAALKVLNLSRDTPDRLPTEWRQDPSGLVTKLEAQPSPYDDELRERISSLGANMFSGSGMSLTIEQIIAPWQRSVASRRRYEQAADSFGNRAAEWPRMFWIHGGGIGGDSESSLVVAQRWPAALLKPPQGETQFVIFPQNVLQHEFEALLTRSPDAAPFSMRLEIAGGGMIIAMHDGRLICRFVSSGGEARAEPPFEVYGQASIADAPLTVKIMITDPKTFFAAQQKRQWLFAGLLLAAAGTCGMGYFSARRAFYRQLHLSEMKSNFVASVSHELRAPIASLRLMAESLDRGTVQEPQKQKEYFHFIVQECRRLSSLIENVLDFSRIERGRKQYEIEPADVVALAQQTVTLMGAQGTEQHLKITLQVDGGAAPVEMDAKAIQQALVNIIDNAIKHSPSGAEIKVGLAFAKDAGVAIWVEDQGEGIPPGEHEKIFEQFYRLGSELRRETQGVGIGLSIVKHIVAAHGGRVIVRSAKGQGSRFTMELPGVAAPKNPSTGT